MALSDIKDPESVIAAMREYDDIGPKAFKKKYKLDTAKKLFVKYEGRDYPAKAILGAAHGYATSLGHLTGKDFKSSKPAVVKRLTALGFEVIDTSTKSEDWTDEEIRVAVEVYLEMLDLHQSGEQFVKADFRRRTLAGPLSTRNESAYEYRMQNISAVMESKFGLEWLKGYPPAKQVGPGPTAKIAKVLEEKLGLPAKHYETTTDETELERETSEARKRLKSARKKPRPQGASNPKSSEKTATVYERDPLVKAWVLDNARGVCECCGKNAPFISANGEPFLEVHHVKRLADEGPDTVENAVALCPNCHREAHYCLDREAWKERMYSTVARLVRY